MPPKAIKWLTFILSVLALIGFVVVYWKLLTTVWTKDSQPQPNFSFLASSLAGLVGGIVAAAFGQKLPKSAGFRTRLMNKLSAFGGFIGPISDGSLRVIMAVGYAVVYIVMSIWAIVVWAGDKPNTPELTNNLAIISLGLFAAIVTAYLNDTNK